MTIDTIQQKHRPAHILLVEDNHGDVILTRRAFKESKIANELSVASTGEEALAMLRKQGKYAQCDLPDLILLDLNLPKMSGQDVLETVKNDPCLQHIPVLILSSSQAERDVIRSYNLHANGYVVKPVTLDNFIDLANKVEQFWFTLVVLLNGEDVNSAS